MVPIQPFDLVRSPGGVFSLVTQLHAASATLAQGDGLMFDATLGGIELIRAAPGSPSVANFGWAVRLRAADDPDYHESLKLRELRHHVTTLLLIWFGHPDNLQFEAAIRAYLAGHADVQGKTCGQSIRRMALAYLAPAGSIEESRRGPIIALIDRALQLVDWGEVVRHLRAMR